MEDRETARMRKYGESKMTRIMMATVPHITSGLGLRKFQANGFLLTRVYVFVTIVHKSVFLMTLNYTAYHENETTCVPLVYYRLKQSNVQVVLDAQDQENATVCTLSVPTEMKCCLHQYLKSSALTWPLLFFSSRQWALMICFILISWMLLL